MISPNNLRVVLNILGIWCFVLGSFFVSVAILPHRDFPWSSAVLASLMLLIAIISFIDATREETKRNKAVFFNFALFFGFSLHMFVYPFIGRAFLVNHPYASFFTYQYASNGLAYFLLAFSVVYVVIDTLFSHHKIYQKYLLTFLILGGTFAYYYYPMIENPKYLYETADIQDFREVSQVVTKLNKHGIRNPTVEEVAAAVSLHAWKDGVKVGTLFDDAKKARVAELLPYLHSDNVLVLMFKPLYSNVIYMNILCLVFLLVFFGYQYKNDPPQGAYIEKILFLFLPYCSLEILHYFSYIKSVELAAYFQIYDIGVYLMVAVLLGMLLFFSLRLRFIMSVTGTYYERELVSDPEHISRWRDSIDGLIVRYFLNPKTLHGRLLAPRPPKTTA